MFAALLEYSIILLRIKLYRDESRVSVSSTPFYIPMEMWSIREPPYMTSALEEGIVETPAKSSVKLGEWDSDKGEGGQKNPKILRTSLMEAP